MAIYWKKKELPVELINEFFGDSISFHWEALYPFTRYLRENETVERFNNFESLYLAIKNIKRKK